MFNKILIANRGEIAVRVIRACREMGVRTVAIYSDADRSALHVRKADEAYRVGPPPSAESYLRVDRILEVARQSQAEAIHPGYGFLAENPTFAEACERAGVVFIGPSSETLRLSGSKTASRRLAKQVGVPTVPGTDEDLSDEEILRRAPEIGFPLLVKAAAGGGGKGMRVVQDPVELQSAIRAARSEGQSSFGDAAVFLEKYLIRPRHIEMQVLADPTGHTLYLGERECSLQRRHQKVVEEAPSPFMTPELRKQMGEAAVALARGCGYRNAGTIEFLVDADRNFYFLEINARLQVEHPVTELTTGIDLVKNQIRIAAGERLTLRQEELKTHGHAIECRIYAEDRSNNFAPFPGGITLYRPPGGPGIRDDTGVYEGFEVPIYYDPLISKLVAWGKDRHEAISRVRRALQDYLIAGIKTSVSFLVEVMADPRFLEGDADTTFIDTFLQQKGVGEPRYRDVAVVAAAIHTYRMERERKPAAPTGGTAAGSAWTMAARHDALRRS
ncbi:MAG: acetyl/propionyl/methylcrotonyl-CoA carboxylase subunit alpha [Candidatus Methylomirabilales bacterium]